MEGAYSGGGAGQPPRQLRPLGVGEVLDAAIKLYTRNAVTMWKIVASIIVPLAIIQELVVAVSLPSGAFVRGGTLYTPSGSPAAGSVAEIVLGLIGVLVVNGALALCLVDSYVGQPLDWMASLRAAVDRLGPLLWLAIIYGIIVTIAFILLIVPGIWLTVAWCVAVPALMFEGLSGFHALRRSYELIRGRWWATFAALLVAGIMLFVALLVIGLIFGGIQSGLSVGSVGLWLVLRGISSIISDLIVFPFIGAVVAVIYIDMRVRKEALDLELLAGSFGRPGSSAGPQTSL